MSDPEKEIDDAIGDDDEHHARKPTEPSVFPIADIASIGARMIAKFSARPCGGEREGIPKCTPDVLAKCSDKDAPGCPRKIVEYEAELVEFKATERQRRDAELIRKAQIPSKLAFLLTRPLIETGPLSEVRQWMFTSTTWILLAGGFGVGKSLAAAWALVQRPGGIWARAPRLADLAINDKPRYVAIRTAPLLVIDELGLNSEGTSGWSIGLVEDLLGERDENDAKTIITTNLNLEMFRKTYRERVWDRVRVGELINCEGPSLRGRV